MLYESLRKAPKVAVGAKQTAKALESADVSMVYIAQDAEDRIVRPIREMCAAKGIPVKEAVSMKELGKACKIQVGAAVAAVLAE